MDSIAACEDIKINGGDDVNKDDIPSECHPTWCDVLKAASTINKYLNDLDNPIAYKLEALLIQWVNSYPGASTEGYGL